MYVYLINILTYIFSLSLYCKQNIISLMPSRCYCAFCPHLLFLHRLMFCWCCSEVGGQHTDHYHRLSCGRSHCINNGLHAAQELYSLCSLQAWGEKVSKIQVLSVTTADCHPGALFFILKLLNSNFLSPPPPPPSIAVRSALYPRQGSTTLKTASQDPKLLQSRHQKRNEKVHVR